MHIKELVLDGFKSYATRTVVSGFDAKFNAITGLNGSGKSNILDGICFVLGITQLNQVRVSNLQGLVYKQGQAGVTKASVTIVFDNSDSSQSPVGYEQYKEITITRQVVIGGRNKYLINGHNAQVSQVQNLFHSVQLNVNNPHFLIMQGRITKVLNMKPPEILGLIEEASGTRMYETKKLAAQKKMEQKQVKVDEIQKLLTEEITPKLEKLRGEKQSYLKWAANNTEVERLRRFCIAYDFAETDSLLQESSSNLQALQDGVEENRVKYDQFLQQKNELTERKEQLVEKRSREMEGDYQRLTSDEENLSKKLVKENSVLQNKINALKQESKTRAGLDKQITDLEESIGTIKENILKNEKEFEVLCKRVEECQDNVGIAQRNVQAALSGISAQQADGSASTGTLQEQLMEAKKTVTEATAEAKQLQMKKKHLEKQLVKNAKQVEKLKTSNAKIDAELKEKSDAVKAAQDEQNALEFDNSSAINMKTQLKEKEAALEEAKFELEKLWSKLARFDFQFSSPSRDFDRSKVKGLVARLVKVKDTAAANALEVVAGGKLYQVVVDSVQTGKQLLSKGKLKRRVTIIPLDKVSAREIPSQKALRAAAIAHQAGGTAQPALSLVGYDDEVEAAMKYVFGTTLVCDSLEVARSVTFDRDVKVRSVTLEGDSFDPQGTLSGGSRSSNSSVLLQLHKLSEAQDHHDQLEKRVCELREQITSFAQKEDKFNKLSRVVELRQHELSLLEDRLKNTEYSQLCAHQEEMTNSMEDTNLGITQAEAKAQQARESCALLEHEIEHEESRRERLTKEANDALDVAKQTLVSETKSKQEVQKTLDADRTDLEEQESELESATQQRIEIEQGISKLTEEVSQLEEVVSAYKSEYQRAKELLEAKKQALSSCDSEIASLSKELTQIAKLLHDTELEVKKLEGKYNRLVKDRANSEDHCAQLLAKHPWIETEKQFFGKPHTDYDFEEKDPREEKRLLKKLEEAQGKLSKQINKKVMGMIEKAEKEYNDLVKKRQIIENDRETIVRVIAGLDKKKNEALETTWAKVNKDFGSIFSTLLRGTQAKLEPPEGCTVLDGLEVKVAFGDTWKESLTELSGGQRSLLALSLILALLLFKPAPMYILDEVDAALDLSHTQNIGQMLRTHFAHSQFIVVSLKEGMFNNANVIFRTKFVDGVSTVRRTSGQRAALTNEPQDDQENNSTGNQTTARRGGKKTSSTTARAVGRTLR